MANRRDFLKTVGATTAGALMMTRLGGALGQSTRREIFIGGQRATTVDMHAHCAFSEVAKLTKGTGLAGSGLPPIGPDRLDEMNQRGIDYQVLSINRYWWYLADRGLAADIVKLNDESLAAWVDEHPDRFVALSSPALQYPELAAEQLEYAVKKLGLRGASVGGHCNNESLSGPNYDPFWAKAEELGVPVFMHPTDAENLIRDGRLSGRGNLSNVVGNPLETTVFLSRMIFDGTLDKFPGLRVVAAHGGGFLPSYLGRTEVACQARSAANCANTKLPSEYLRDQILVDTMVFSDEGLRHLVAEMGAKQLVYGTDMPFDWPDTLDLVLNAGFLSDAEKRAIVGGTLVELLGIKVG